MHYYHRIYTTQGLNSRGLQLMTSPALLLRLAAEQGCTPSSAASKTGIPVEPVKLV